MFHLDCLIYKSLYINRLRNTKTLPLSGINDEIFSETDLRYNYRDFQCIIKLIMFKNKY